MRQTLTVIRIVSSTKAMAIDSAKRTFPVRTDRVLTVGQSILVINGVLTATITKKAEKAYEV